FTANRNIPKSAFSLPVSVVSFPTESAERKKMRSAQTIGVESPSPGMASFHLMLLVSLQLSGGSACGATPVPRGPRHWGQNSSPCESAAAFAATYIVSAKMVLKDFINSE